MPVPFTLTLDWKAIGDGLQRPCDLSRVDQGWKIWDRKQITDNGKYSFVNRNIENWNQLPAEALGISLVSLTFLETVRKEIIKWVK